MKIIKRNGEEREFDTARIENAIAKASASVSPLDALTARQIGRDQSHVANIIGLCQLSPKIIHAVITGDYPSTLTLNSLKKKLPDLWSEQEAMLLGEN